MDDMELLECQKYSAPKNDDTFYRAQQVADELLYICDMFDPDIVALEGLAFGSVGNATRDLAGLQFTIVNHLRKQGGMTVKIYSPQSVKKMATGKGNAKKAELVNHLPTDVRAMFDKLGVKKTTGLMDLTDAYFIGVCAHNDV